MKNTRRILALLIVLCMALSLSAFASGEASSASGENASAALEHKSVADMTASPYSRMTSFASRDDTGMLFIGNDVTESADIVLAEEVEGAAYTAVYAHGDGVVANVTGTLIAYDDTAGEWASDFSGQGAVIVANDGGTVNVKDLTIWTDGFERSAAVVSERGTVRVENCDFTVLGANPITEAYDGYNNGADMDLMLSPPWVLGIQGGARGVNMIGASPVITVIDSRIASGGWADISTDSGSNATMNVVDSEMIMLPESEGGMDSGWRIFGYDEDAYGSGYGTFNIGSPAEYFYGTTITGATMATIIMGAKTDVYASSNGSIELIDASGEPLETVQGKGQNTVVNTVFGVMQCGATGDGVYIKDGTVFNTEEAIVLHKAGNGDYYFDDATLNSKRGILLQMMDSDDDSIRFDRTGGYIGPTYDESKLSVSGVGFPGVNYDCSSRAGSTKVNATFTNGVYEGNLYNGSGYYGMSAGSLTVTVGEGAVLNGDIALTSTIKGVPYSPEALEGIAYYGNDIGYVLLDADGSETANEAEAAFIQTRSYTITQYFLQGHVENMLHYNGASTIEVVVEDGAEWNVAGESLITKLTVADGAKVKGTLTVNDDGTLTLAAGDELIPAGEYGTIEPASGGSSSGEASGSASGEASGSASGEASGSASGEASGSASGEASGSASGEAS